MPMIDGSLRGGTDSDNARLRIHQLLTWTGHDAVNRAAAQAPASSLSAGKVINSCTRSSRGRTSSSRRGEETVVVSKRFLIAESPSPAAPRPTRSSHSAGNRTDVRPDPQSDNWGAHISVERSEQAIAHMRTSAVGIPIRPRLGLLPVSMLLWINSIRKQRGQNNLTNSSDPFVSQHDQIGTRTRKPL